MTILCLLACMAWIVGLTWMVLNPVERDRQLSHGKVKNLVLIIAAIVTLPLVFAFILSRIDVQPEELVYDDSMYQKWQPYSFQKEVDSLSYSISQGDTAVIYTPKTFRERQMESGRYEDPSLVWAVYYQFLDPGNQSLASSSRGRKIVFILSVLGIILMTGLLVSLTSNVFQRRIERWQEGQIRYSHGLGRYCVVIGDGGLLASTLRQMDDIYGRRLQHILVLTTQDIPDLRRRLLSELPGYLEKKVVLYSGKATELTEIKSLRCKDADEVFILGEENAEDAVHDTMNVRSMALITETLPQTEHRLKVHVLLNDASTYSVFQISELSDEQRKKIEFIPYNIYETCARNVLVENEAGDTKYEPLDTRDGIKANDNRYVHLVIAGMSDMGMHLAVEAAHICHFPNFAHDNSLKTVITFIDSDIETKKLVFKSRYKEMFEIIDGSMSHLVAKGEDSQFLDVEWEFLEGDVRDKDFMYQCVEYRVKDNTLLTIALCYDNPEETTSAALSMPQSLYDKTVQVLAYQRDSDEIMKVLAKSQKTYFAKLRPFGMTDTCVDLSHKLMPLSKLINYAYNHPDDVEMKHAMVDENGNYHDNVNDLWVQQTTANKWSNVYNSDSIPTKMRSIGKVINGTDDIVLSDDDVKTIAEVEHRRWNMEKLLMGFRALTKEEQQLCLTKGENKKRLKNELMAHLDICSLKKLEEVDPASIKYDEDVTRIIPTMIKEHFTPLPELWK